MKITTEQEYDPYLEVAAYLFVKHQKASQVLLMKKFNIGFNRTNKMLGQLESIGVIEKSSSINEPSRLLIKDQDQLNDLLSKVKLGKQYLYKKDWNQEI